MRTGTKSGASDLVVRVLAAALAVCCGCASDWSLAGPDADLMDLFAEDAPDGTVVDDPKLLADGLTGVIGFQLDRGQLFWADDTGVWSMSTSGGTPERRVEWAGIRQMLVWEYWVFWLDEDGVVGRLDRDSGAAEVVARSRDGTSDGLLLHQGMLYWNVYNGIYRIAGGATDQVAEFFATMPYSWGYPQGLAAKDDLLFVLAGCTLYQTPISVVGEWTQRLPDAGLGGGCGLYQHGNELYLSAPDAEVVRTYSLEDDGVELFSDGFHVEHMAFGDDCAVLIDGSGHVKETSLDGYGSYDHYDWESVSGSQVAVDDRWIYGVLTAWASDVTSIRRMPRDAVDDGAW